MIIIMCSIGLVIYANYYKCDPLTAGHLKRIDEIVPYFVIDVLGSVPGLPGLFVACICSASLSTLSSGLNSIAALFWEDIFSKYLPNATPKKAVIGTKFLAAGLGVACVVVAFIASEIGTIFEAFFALSGAPVGPIFAIFLLGLFTPLVNANGALCRLLFGQVCCFAINVGAIVSKYRKGILLSSTEQCDASIVTNSTIPYIEFTNLTKYRIPVLQPEGMNYIFHLSHFIVPIVGFLTCVIFALIIRIFTGCNRDREEPNLLNGAVVKLLNLNVAYQNDVK